MTRDNANPDAPDPDEPGRPAGKERVSPPPPTTRAGAEPEAFTGGGPVVTPDDEERRNDGPAWSPKEQEPWYTRRRWAGRLGFPLMVVALLLAWRGLQAGEAPGESALPVWAWWTLAMLSAFFGLLMVRLRYQPRDQSENGPD